MLLSEHLRRYRGLSRKSFKNFQTRLISLFPIDSRCTAEAVHYLNDSLETIGKSYFDIKSQNNLNEEETEPTQMLNKSFEEFHDSQSEHGWLANFPIDSSFAAHVPPQSSS